MELDRIVSQGEIYKHFKGNLYQITAIAYEEETMKKVVVYQALYGTFEYFTRDYENFISEVDRKKYPQFLQKYKFELVDMKEFGKSADIVNESFFKEDTQNEEILKENILKKASLDKQNMEADNMLITKNMNEKVYGEKSEQIRKGRTKEELIRFLEADYYKDKIEIITYMERNNLLTESILIDMAVSIDCVLEDESIEEQYESVLKCLKTLARYQSRRLRKPEILVK